jgi:hypothetical protein
MMWWEIAGFVSFGLGLAAYTGYRIGLATGDVYQRAIERNAYERALARDGDRGWPDN